MIGLHQMSQNINLSQAPWYEKPIANLNHFCCDNVSEKFKDQEHMK